MRHSILFYLIALILSMMPCSIYGQQVTNEQLRDGLLSLVHSYSLLENKLDRHEQRERALGDVIKRGLQTLQKGQKIFEPMRGTFVRLDERIGQIETELMAQHKKSTDQQEKIENALNTIMKWMVDNTGTTKVPKDDSSEERSDGLTKKVDDLNENVMNLRRELADMKSERETSETVAKNILEQMEKLMSSKQDSTDEVISKLEEKLTHFYVTSPVSTPTPAVRNSDWEENVSTLLKEIKSNTNLSPRSAVGSTDIVPTDKEFFVGLANDTLAAIEEMRMEVLTASDKSFTKTAARIKEVSESLDSSLSEILKSVSESESSFENIIQSNKNLQKDISGLGKLEKIVLDTGDNVLSIKRGMEFNVHAITLEIGELIKSQAKKMNSTFHKRFDNLNATIVENQNEALSNLTYKIETEISQVWRQIGIMYQEVSSSKDALNKLQEQTESYINGTFTTLDSMTGKVSQITGRMAEVDENLNYLLGRLSLVTHEFNEIKNGLGTALDNIRGSFKLVQEKIQDAGPGPHQIPSHEFDEQ